MGLANWSSTKKGITFLLSGTVGAQLILVLSLPFLSRLFSPQDFGIFTLITSITSLLVPLATLRLESAAMLPSAQSRASALVFVSFVSISLTCILSILILGRLSQNGQIDTFGLDNFGIWVGVFVLSYSLFLLLSQIALRELKYSQVAKRTLTRSIATSVIQLGLGLWKFFPNGLLIGGIIGQLIGLLPMAKTIKPYLKLPSVHLCRSVLREYWRFPLVFTPSALMNSLGLYAPLIFFTSLYGVDQGGQLGMAERIISMPLALVGVAVGQVVDAEAAKIVRQHQRGLLRTFLKFSGILGGVGIAVSLIGISLGSMVVPWVLGSSWDQAGVYVQILAISAGLRLLSSPLSKFLILLQKSLLNTWLDIIRVILICASMAYIVLNEVDAVPAVWILYTSLAINYVISWLATHVSVKKYESAAEKAV